MDIPCKYRIVQLSSDYSPILCLTSHSDKKFGHRQFLHQLFISYLQTAQYETPHPAKRALSGLPSRPDQFAYFYPSQSRHP